MSNKTLEELKLQVITNVQGGCHFPSGSADLNQKADFQS